MKLHQLAALMDIVEFNDVGMKEKIKEEVNRIKRFQSSLLENTAPSKATEIDVRKYAKYILKYGKVEEKRDLLGCLKSKIYLNEKAIKLY